MVEKSAENLKERRFEESLSELEKVVRGLEGPDLTLDQSLSAFERGVGLVRECEARLEEAKAKVEKLVKAADGTIRTEKFEPRE